MANFLPKSLKDMRRRSVEYAFGSLGGSERTTDPEYEAHDLNFKKTMRDLNDCGSNLNSAIVHNMKATTDGKALATALDDVYKRCNNEPYSMPDGRPLAPENLEQTGSAEAYKDCWDTINDSIRSVTQAVLDEQALAPLRAAVTSAQPEYEKLKGARSNAVLDFDANRRRLDQYKEQKKDNERKGKHVGEMAITQDTKIERYESKKAIAGKTYETINEELKAFCGQTKEKHDVLVDELVINAAVCQLEMYKRAAAELQKVVDILPQDRVAEVTGRIDELMAAGGHIIAAPVEKRKRPSMLDGFRDSLGSMMGGGGGAAGSRGSSGSAAPPSPQQEQQQQGHVAMELPTAPVEDDGNPFGDNDTSAVEEAPPAPSAPAPTSPMKSRMVRAMYDHEAEADDELSFKVGDMVEVLETGDGGWWSGKCHGNVGDFPVDFVDISNFSM